MILDAIDATIAERLLAAALGSGGDYADLYFEYRSGADFVLEEGRVRTVGRGVTLGLGVRVLRGDATGYAYTEELSDDRMLEAARTAAQIASSGGAPAPVAIPPIALPNSTRSRAVAGAPGRRQGRAAPPRRHRGARRRPAHRARRGVAGRGAAEVLVVTSDGQLARDRQPMIRFSVSAVAEEGEGPPQRQGGRSGGAGRFGMEYFPRPGQSPEEHGREAARLAIGMLHAVEAPAGPMEVVLGAGESGILLHEAVGHGLEADFNRKRTSNYTDQIGQSVASALCTVIDDGTIGNARGSINVDDEGNPGRRNVLIQDGILVGYMQDRISAKHFGIAPVGQRAAPELSPRAAAAHDQHHHGAGPGRSGGHHPLGEARRVREALLGRAGQHLERRLRLRADRELPDRGRQAHRAAQGREPDRQRPGRVAQGDDARQRLQAVGRHLDLRQGRAVGAGRHRHTDDEDRRDHRRRDADLDERRAAWNRPAGACPTPRRASAWPSRCWRCRWPPAPTAPRCWCATAPSSRSRSASASRS